MNYPQFFAILSNQCQRFAPEVAVPTDFERVLTELRSITDLGELDESLRLAFTALLTPRFTALLSEAHGAVTDIVQERVAAVDKQRTDAMVELEKSRAAALAQEQAAQAQAQATLRQIAEQHDRIVALESQLRTLKGA